MELEVRLKQIIFGDDRLMRILKTARQLNLNDWYVAGGAIRNSVWDKLSEFKEHTLLNDVDLVYFNKYHTDYVSDEILSEEMNKKFPEFKWEIKNQLKYQPPGEIYRTSVDGIARWIETPTCVGARLEKDGNLIICAPWGLEDLFSGDIRINPKWPKPEYFKKRMEDKRWDKIWPNLSYIPNTSQ